MNPPNQPGAELWSDHPSQWLNVKAYFFALILIAAAVALLIWESDIAIFLVQWHAGPAGDHITTAAGALIAIAGLYMLFRYLLVHSQCYRLRNGALELETGILSRRTDVLDLFRIHDVTETRPLLMRLCGLGNIHIVSTDSSTPNLALRAIRRSPHVLQLLRSEVMKSRAQNRVIVEDK